MLKSKLNQDQIAMIIADWTHGELTTCDDMPPDCNGCPLDKNFINGNTICQTIELMAEKLEEVEK